jgi:hypothetical protein
MIIRFFNFVKVLISKIIYYDKNFDKTIDFMKVLISKYFYKSYDDNIFDKTINLMKSYK